MPALPPSNLLVCLCGDMHSIWNPSSQKGTYLYGQNEQNWTMEKSHFHLLFAVVVLFQFQLVYVKQSELRDELCEQIEVSECYMLGFKNQYITNFYQFTHDDQTPIKDVQECVSFTYIHVYMPRHVCVILT